MVDVGPRLEMPLVETGIVVPSMGIVERPLTIVVMVAYPNAKHQALLRHRLQVLSHYVVNKFFYLLTLYSPGYKSENKG